MNKAQTSILVSIIALTFTLVVLLVVVFPPFRALVLGTSETGQCQFSVLLSSLAKKISFGFGDIPPACKMKRMTITPDDLERYERLASRTTERFEELGLTKAVSEFPDTEYGHLKWALHRVIANEMIDCYNKGWRGQMDLKASGWPTDILEETGAYLCILCTRIKFDQDLRNLFGARRTFYMDTWLKANNREGKTYYQLITEGVTPFFRGFVDQANFNIDKNQAVIFIAGINKEKGDLGTTGTAGVGIFEYDKLTTDLGFDEVRKIDRGTSVVLGAVLFGPLGAIGAALAPGDAEDIELSRETAYCATIIGD